MARTSRITTATSRWCRNAERFNRLGRSSPGRLRVFDRCGSAAVGAQCGVTHLPRFGWTVEKLHQLPDDGFRYECIDGELFVSPSPRWLHQLVAVELFLDLANYVRRTRAGLIVVAPTDVKYSETTLVQPDILIATTAHGEGLRPADADDMLLAVEVLSPSSVRYDRVRNRALYLASGRTDYWVVDPQGRALEWWYPGAHTPSRHTAGTLTWQPRTTDEPFTVDLTQLFSESRFGLWPREIVDTPLLPPMGEE
jgi:Uma2 family endonuclease